ncbi:MAG: hypothetical protein AB7V26_01685 [Lysobacterales bacterium]
MIFPTFKEKKSVLPVAALLLGMLAGCAIAAESEAPQPQSARYVGQTGKNGEFAAYRMTIAGSRLTAEVLLGEDGERTLVLSDAKTGQSQAHVLPKHERSADEKTVAKMQTVTYEVVWTHPNGAQLLAVKIDGDVVGFIMVQADGTFQFTTAER